MSYGYSLKVVLLNQKADQTRLGVRLGKKCIKLGIPVVDIAERLGVSRQTVYNWFIGDYEPTKELTDSVRNLIRNIKR